MYKRQIVFLRGLNVVSPDGNKRIGAHVMLVFLAINGIELDYTQEELIDIILQIASGRAKACLLYTSIAFIDIWRITLIYICIRSS